MSSSSQQDEYVKVYVIAGPFYTFEYGPILVFEDEGDAYKFLDESEEYDRDHFAVTPLYFIAKGQVVTQELVSE